MLTAQFVHSLKKAAKADGRPYTYIRIPSPRKGCMIDSGRLAKWVAHDGWGDTPVMRSCRGGDRDATRAVDSYGWFLDNHNCEVVFSCAVKIRVPRRIAREESVESDCIYSEGQSTRVRWVESLETSWGATYASRKKGDRHDSMTDTLRCADYEARMFAEESREIETKFEAECRIDDLKEEIKSSREMVMECVFELRLMRKHYQSLLVSSEVLKDRIRSEWASITKNRKQIQKLINEPWSIAA